MKRRLDATETDVTLKVADKTFPCRRRVLADCSPYFDAMFNSGFVERDKNVIEIKGVDTDAMDILLHSTEASEVDILRSTNVLSVLQASCMLQFEAVKKSCIELIVNKWLAVDSCLQIASTAQELDLHDLRDKAMALALWEFSQVKETDSFFRLPVAGLEAYLQDDGLNVRRGEFEVFDAGIDWIEENVEERSQFLMRVIQCVRFVEVARDDIQTMLLYPRVVENVEVTQLLECIYDMKFSARKDCPDIVSDDSTMPAKFEDDTLLEGFNDSTQAPPTENAIGCYERLCQCAYFSGASTGVSKTVPLDGCRATCVGTCCIPPEKSTSNESLESNDIPIVPLPSRRPRGRFPGRSWDTSTSDAACKFLQQLPRWLPIMPCVIGHTTEEVQGARLPPGKPFVFCYDKSKGDVVPVVELAKISDGPVELSGYKIASRGPSIYITGGEFLLGHGSWNRTMWKYSLLSESWGYETSIPSARRHHSVCFMDDDLYLIGGFGKHRVIMNSVEKYNVTTKTWTRCAPLPQPLYSAACVAHQGRILVFSQQLFVYNPEWDAWAFMVLHVSPGCLGFNSAVSHKDAIYLTGMYSTMLARYLPDKSTVTEEKFVYSVGNFTYSAANTCVVGDRIYNFTSDDESDSLFLEAYCINEDQFQVVWCSKDSAVAFSQSKKWSSSFPLVKY